MHRPVHCTSDARSHKSQVPILNFMKLRSDIQEFRILNIGPSKDKTNINNKIRFTLLYIYFSQHNYIIKIEVKTTCFDLKSHRQAKLRTILDPQYKYNSITDISHAIYTVPITAHTVSHLGSLMCAATL
jgi:hypothetical protein